MTHEDTSKETSYAGEVLFWGGILFAICSNEQLQQLRYVGPLLPTIGTIAGIVMAAYGKRGLKAARDNDKSDQDVGLRPDPLDPTRSF